MADAADRPALDELAASTSVVVSTVGPYALDGSELVGAVVEAGVDYCDLTGEVQWMHDDRRAPGSCGADRSPLFVHVCGFDSIPSDLGVWFTQQRAIETFGEPWRTEVRMSVAGVWGGVSGGTVASGLNMFEEMANDPELRVITSDPYVLAPIDQRHGPKQPGTAAEYAKTPGSTAGWHRSSWRPPTAQWSFGATPCSVCHGGGTSRTARR